MAAHDPTEEVDAVAYTTFIRLAFTPYSIHFKSPRYMREETLRRIDNEFVKETVRLTSAKVYVRLAIGRSRPFWEDMVTTVRAATTSFERRSFQQWDPTSVDYESTSSTLLAAAYPGLWHDLDRICDLLKIARNVLTIGPEAQDLCAEVGFDHIMFKLINCCIRVTARGYDGEAGSSDEERWQHIVHRYKYALVLSLQLLNNLCAKNEQRKTLLWMSLFDSGDQPLSGIEEHVVDETLSSQVRNDDDMAVSKQQRSYSEGDTYAINKTRHAELAQSGSRVTSLNETNATISDSTFANEHTEGAYRLFVASARAQDASLVEGRETVGQRSLAKRWLLLDSTQRQYWIDQYTRRSDGVQLDEAAETSRTSQTNGKAIDRGVNDDEMAINRSATQDPYAIAFSADEGYRALQAAKDELYKRASTEQLQRAQAPAGELALESTVIEPQDQEDPGQVVTAPEDASVSDQSESQDDYRAGAEDGRGLLTDVPLILGPSEIEILTNIIMSGLVPDGMTNVTKEQVTTILDMYGSRCHLLLAQENGRNLLRELLIFVAAWDLREEELYFKFMVRIIEAILLNELLPYAYDAFKDHSKSRSKDVISPAQAVIMKLLTNLFRQYAESNKNTLLEMGNVREPSLVEVHVVRYIVTEFRQHIIPQTCSLIHLQGKIRDHLAHPEDFPLNLWDMERMYEGVYQYLEFFAVLTEEAYWKDIMAKWEVANELVTMLMELELAIPKLHTVAQDPPDLVAQLPYELTGPRSSLKAKHISPTPKPATEAMMKANLPPLPPLPSDPQGSPDSLDSEELDAPLPYPAEEASEEPSDFEWRNLKKLTVLVLSSLIWKNKQVQDQVREYDGLRALVGCCRPDEHNPYIREHAIMCLRFAVENNDESAQVIRTMAERYERRNELMAAMDPQAVADLHPQAFLEVPREVLDTQGYETFMDGKGQVGLRRKDVALLPTLPSPPLFGGRSGGAALQAAAAQALAGAFAGTRGVTDQAAFDRAAEIMRTALKELPLPKSLDKLKDDQGLIDRLNKVALEHVELIAPGAAIKISTHVSGPS